MKEFMTYEMALLEKRLEGEQQGLNKGIESVAIKLIHMGLSFTDIQKATDLPIHRLEQLAHDNPDD